jgi:hypothetical protein
MKQTAALAVAALILAELTLPSSALAVTVEGDVVVPPNVEGPATPYLGFIEQPILNPITSLRPFDPRPEIFVFLDGGPVAAEDSTPPAAPLVWALGSHSFSPTLLPVVAGTTVEISNQGRETHLLRAPDVPDILAADPIGPGSSKQIAVKGTAMVKIVSQDVPHLEARVVPVATRYFSRVARDGSFKIENVPAGDWTLRVWYRDGWLAKTVSVSVKDKDKTVKQRVELPAQLEPKPAPAQPAQPAK